jgi:hypothetical protein
VSDDTNPQDDDCLGRDAERQQVRALKRLDADDEEDGDLGAEADE